MTKITNQTAINSRRVSFLAGIADIQYSNAAIGTVLVSNAALGVLIGNNFEVGPVLTIITGLTGGIFAGAASGAYIAEKNDAEVDTKVILGLTGAIAGGVAGGLGASIASITLGTSYTSGIIGGTAGAISPFLILPPIADHSNQAIKHLDDVNSSIEKHPITYKAGKWTLPLVFALSATAAVGYAATNDLTPPATNSINSPSRTVRQASYNEKLLPPTQAFM